MIANMKGRDLFIVDNSVSGWTCLRYLQEWAEISKGFDIATGFFEIGALLALDGKWQLLDKIRILIGTEMTPRTRKALLDALQSEATAGLDASIETAKDSNPFLNGLPAILDALRSRQIEVRVYDKDKFHAKAYITHTKLQVVGSQALVGSSNFTLPGLTKNIELNIQVQSAREVAQLQEWFEAHWNDAHDVTPLVVETIERHVRLYTPFDVYAKALQEYFRGHELSAFEWETTRSLVFPRLDGYQKEAYGALIKIANQYGGAFLCDGVGLGKTVVALMLIERMILHEGKRVVLFAPKPAIEGVWLPHIRTWLPHIGGVGGSTDFSNLAVFNHTDLSRGGVFPERFRRIAELADVVIIDEAHHFRNTGTRGNPEKGIEPSRYYRLYDLLDPAKRPKTVFLLTATPINNRLSDFRHMLELFTRRDDAVFARTLGINNLTAHFVQMETALRARIGHEVTDIADNIQDAQDILVNDALFRALVVQRSRAYVRQSQMREKGSAAIFPERQPPRVAAYSIRKSYGRLLDMVEKAFMRENPLFTLAMYYPLAWYRGPDTSIDPLEKNRQKQVVGLIRTNFLKRFESSVAAFELSCHRLLQKLLAFLELHSATTAEKRRLERWKNQNAELLAYALHRQLDLWGEEQDAADDDDFMPPELLADIPCLDRAHYDVPEMLSETFLDLDNIVAFLNETRQFEPRHDDKLQKLIRLLKSDDLATSKVLIFTEFADTARYLKRQLVLAGITGIAQVDSATKTNRADVIQRFSPYYNGTSSPNLAAEGREEIRVLISTDVLSEGLNLQDASRLINYDIHWNPVRLMQRIGRVDRRMNPAIEARLTADHPQLAPSRGTVVFWNFLPPDELNELLTLYTRVTQKTLLISKTFGIEGKQLLTPDDDYDALKEFNHAYEGTTTTVETMHLEFQDMLKANPALDELLKRLPLAVFSGRAGQDKAPRGVFFCYTIPGLDAHSGQFTEQAGTTKWYFYLPDRDTILEEPSDIVHAIRSSPDTPRHCVMEQKTLLAIRAAVEKHIKNTYLKRIDAPLGVKPILKCWMEVT